MASGYHGPVNIGNPNEYTIMELAEKIIELSGGYGKIIFQRLPDDDPQRRCPDISLAKELLDWSPSVELEEGLRKTIEYFR